MTTEDELMDSSVRLRALEVLGLVIASVGVVEALRTGSAVVGAFFAALAVLGVARLGVHRQPPLDLRPDHWKWLRECSAVTHEPIEVIADRAVGAYRPSLDDDI